MNNHLKQLRGDSTAANHGAISKPLRAHRSCEIVARLEEVPQTQDGQLHFRAAALFDGPHTQAGQIDTYRVRPERVKECLDNLGKGVGAQPGSVLVFGNAWRDQTSDTLSVGWVTTAVSAQKAQARLNGHQRRRVEEVYAQMPVLEFTNTRPVAGEPARIRWALGLDGWETRVTTEGQWHAVSFNRAWLKDKLATAWEDRQQDTVSINLRLPVLYPDEAVAVRDLATATQALVSLLAEHPYRSVLTRLQADGAVETRWQPFMRGKDATAWAARLFSQVPGVDAQGQPVCDTNTGEAVLVDTFSLIQGINNRLLFEAARAGQVKLEFLPRESVLVATKKAPGLAHDVQAILQAERGQDLHQIAYAFGTDPTAISRVALVLQGTEDPARTYVVAGPHRLDPGPAFTVASVPSAHIRLQPATPAPEPPWEEATVSAGGGDDDAADAGHTLPLLEDNELDWELNVEQVIGPTAGHDNAAEDEAAVSGEALPPEEAAVDRGREAAAGKPPISGKPRRAPRNAPPGETQPMDHAPDDTPRGSPSPPAAAPQARPPAPGL